MDRNLKKPGISDETMEGYKGSKTPKSPASNSNRTFGLLSHSGAHSPGPIPCHTAQAGVCAGRRGGGLNHRLWPGSRGRLAGSLQGRGRSTPARSQLRKLEAFPPAAPPEQPWGSSGWTVHSHLLKEMT